MMTAPPANVRPVYAVVGADRFLRNEALARLLATLADAMDSLGPARFDGAQAELAEVLDEVRTPSLLGGRRVVIVDEADAFIKANRTALERYGSAPADSASLIFMCDSLPTRTRLYRIIAEIGEVITFDVPKGRGVVDWITRRAENCYGKRISHTAARVLRDQLGDAPGTLDAELAKLAAYVGERDEITGLDIDALTGHHRAEKVFAVTDAISSQDTESALARWEQVLATDRAAPGRAIAGLAWGVRRLLEALRDRRDGADVRQLARRMYMDPGVLRCRLDNVTVEQLESQQRDLLSADIAVKTGASTIELAVEKFIVRHSAGLAAVR